MGAYFLLSLATGPAFFVRIGTGALAWAAGWVLQAFLVWRVARGGRISRMLLIVVAEAGLIAGVIFLAIRFSWAELGLLLAGGVQVALLLSPAVYLRTRPPDQSYRSSALWRRRGPAPLVAALTVGVLLGLAGAAASAAVISGRVSAYHSDSARVLARQPVLVTLAAGQYGVFGGCLDEWGCAQISPRDLSVRGAVSGVVSTIPYTRLEQRTDGGQPFNRDLTFTVPVREAVRIALDVNPRQPVLIAPAQEEAGLIHREVVAVAACGLLLLGSLAALAWPIASRTGRRAAHPD
ncbi:MAG: hypothetical protein ABSA02_33760 [Trebonia sp.]|jgi:hypothetical protein